MTSKHNKSLQRTHTNDKGSQVWDITAMHSKEEQSKAHRSTTQCKMKQHAQRHKEQMAKPSAAVDALGGKANTRQSSGQERERERERVE